VKVLDVKQGTPEWLQARLGIPTASEFDKIITAKTLKASGSQDKYLAQLVAEWFLGHPIDNGSSQFMERGTAIEDQSRASYELERGIEAERVGFVTTDDGLVGCSPDSLIGERGLLEIKSPGIETHVLALIDPDEFAADHRCQTQGQLWVTSGYRDWVDLRSGHPLLPAVTVRVLPDPAFQKALTLHMEAFLVRLNDARGCKRGTRYPGTRGNKALAEYLGPGRWTRGTRWPRGPRGTRWTRGPRGRDGREGRDGRDGREGREGRDGREGREGREGRDGRDVDAHGPVLGCKADGEGRW
jgi:hypothetical protein